MIKDVGRRSTFVRTLNKWVVICPHAVSKPPFRGTNAAENGRTKVRFRISGPSGRPIWRWSAQCRCYRSTLMSHRVAPAGGCAALSRAIISTCVRLDLTSVMPNAINPGVFVTVWGSLGKHQPGSRLKVALPQALVDPRGRRHSPVIVY
jgi:hypothetical protein